MARTVTLGILSDIHYASAAEQAHGDDYSYRGITNTLLRALAKTYYRFVWTRDALRQNHLLDRFLEHGAGFDYVIANGDYTCDCAMVGVSDEAACQSAQECLGKLRQRFGTRLLANYGDHELGKVSLFGDRGGMRLASWRRAQRDLDLQPCWNFALGKYVLLGVVSSLVALPVFEADTLPPERAEWERLREEHLADIRGVFSELRPEQRLLLFCHDPTALPFLWREPAVRSRLAQIEHTVIGHLHSQLVFWKSRMLAGMPPIGFLGHSLKRFSTALSEARHWRPFNVRLCPSLAGIELFKQGGYCTITLDPDAQQPSRFQFRRLKRDAH
jgi:hypothetical protein